IDPAVEGSVLDALDGLEERVVDSLDHRRKDVALGLPLSHLAWRLIVLVGIDADGELAHSPCRLEDAQPRRAGGVVDDVGALLVLTQRQLLALSRIAEGI